MDLTYVTIVFISGGCSQFELFVTVGYLHEEIILGGGALYANECFPPSNIVHATSFQFPQKGSWKRMTQICVGGGILIF